MVERALNKPQPCWLPPLQSMYLVNVFVAPSSLRSTRPNVYEVLRAEVARLLRGVAQLGKTIALTNQSDSSSWRNDLVPLEGVHFAVPVGSN